MKLKNPAYVFNCHYNGLAIIQSLGSKGVPVKALDSRRLVGTYSRFAEYIQSPEPMESEELFIDFLYNKAAQEKHPPVLIPTHDDWASAISRHKDKLSEVAFPCVSNWSNLELFINKRNFYEWAHTVGYPVPQTWTEKEALELHESVFPIVVKPLFRRLSRSQKEGTFPTRAELDMVRYKIIYSKADLERFLFINKSLSPYLLFQEHVKGLGNNMYTVGVYADRNSKLLGVFTGRKIRGSHPDYGDCTFGQAQAVPEMLIEITKDIVERTNFTGLAQIEFKQDEQSGEYKLLEVNGRSWSWVGIVEYCGVNLPWLAYRDLIGLEVESPSQSSSAVKFVFLLQDMESCLWRYRIMGYPDWVLSPLQWIKSFWGKTTYFADFSHWDVLPSIFCVLTSLKRTAGDLKRKLFKN